MFTLMPTMFGVDNTLLYFPNSLFTVDFDGFPTLISPMLGLIAFVVPRPRRNAVKPPLKTIRNACLGDLCSLSFAMP
jgi:hypothetical protein